MRETKDEIVLLPFPADRLIADSCGDIGNEIASSTVHEATH